MTQPLISICMPTLNSRRYLNERIESIRAQSCKEWELIVMDSYSQDGTFEVLQDFARGDARVRLYQADRDGIYSNINRCIDLAGGEYVYIATSDDSMSTDCLELMVAALARHPECGLCHCGLSIISSDGSQVTGDGSWESFSSQRFFGDLLLQAHVRYAPHDGVLHLCFMGLYTSLTQLLIRRCVFRTCGRFRTDLGSIADFEWSMKVSLSENTVHIPRKLATWRRHEGQSTQTEGLLKAAAQGKFYQMSAEAIRELGGRNKSMRDALRRSPLRGVHLVGQVAAGLILNRSLGTRLPFLLVFALTHPLFTLNWIFHKVILRVRFLNDRRALFHDECDRLGCRGLVVKVPESHG